MKKLISLIASLSLAATMVAPAFAADAAVQAPVVESTVVEYSAADFLAATGVTLEEGQKGFLMTVNANGFDLESKAGTGFNAAKRSGVMITTIDYRVTLADPSKLVAVMAMDDGTCASAPGEIYCNMSKGSANDAYPSGVANGDTTGKTATDVYLNTFAIVTAGAVDATVAAEFIVVPFTNGTAGAQAVYRNDKSNISYTVNGVAGSTIKFGASAPVDPIVVGTRHDLAAGKAWDVTINEFDAAKTYTATFTDTDTTETKVNDFDLSIFAESDGAKVAFVTLLKTTRANITLDVE